MKSTRRIMIIALVLTLILAIGITAYAVEVKANPRWDVLMEITHEEEMRRLEIAANAPKGSAPIDFGPNLMRFFDENGKLTDEANALIDERLAQNAAE